MSDMDDGFETCVMHPAVPFRVRKGGPGYDKGARFYLEDIAGDRFYFAELIPMLDFAFMHKIRFAKPAEMRMLRRRPSRGG